MNGRFLGARRTGVQRFSLELTRSLIEIADVVLFTPGGAIGSRLPSELHPQESNFGTLRGPLWEQVELPFRARQAAVDVVLHPANSAPRWGGPHVQVLHDLTPVSRPSDFRAAYRAWVRFAHVGGARAACRVLTVSGYSAGRIAAATGISASRIGVVTQGLRPFDAPAPPAEIARVRSDFGLPDRYFLGSGAGDPRKGVAFLESVFAKSGGRAARDSALVVVGASTGRVHRPRPSAHSSIHELGFVSDHDLRALYSGASAFLFPSVEEGFGRPPLEALACGTRVVVGPYEAAAEVLGDHADRIPLDVQAWRRVIRDVLDEPLAERARRIALGRAHAAGFTWHGAAEAVLEACQQAIEPAATE